MLLCVDGHFHPPVVCMMIILSDVKIGSVSQQERSVSLLPLVSSSAYILPISPRARQLLTESNTPCQESAVRNDTR